MLELLSLTSVSSTTALEAAGQLRSELLQGIEIVLAAMGKDAAPKKEAAPAEATPKAKTK